MTTRPMPVKPTKPIVVAESVRDEVRRCGAAYSMNLKCTVAAMVRCWRAATEDQRMRAIQQPLPKRRST